MAGGFFATNLGGMQVLGLEGWRCAFHLVAIVSVTTSVLVMWLAVDPRQKSVVRRCLLRHSECVQSFRTTQFSHPGQEGGAACSLLCQTGAAPSRVKLLGITGLVVRCCCSQRLPLPIKTLHRSRNKRLPGLSICCGIHCGAPVILVVMTGIATLTD